MLKLATTRIQNHEGTTTPQNLELVLEKTRDFEDFRKIFKILVGMFPDFVIFIRNCVDFVILIKIMKNKKHFSKIFLKWFFSI